MDGYHGLREADLGSQQIADNLEEEPRLLSLREIVHRHDQLSAQRKGVGEEFKWTPQATKYNVQSMDNIMHSTLKMLHLVPMHHIAPKANQNTD